MLWTVCSLNAFSRAKGDQSCPALLAVNPVWPCHRSFSASWARAADTPAGYLDTVTGEVTATQPSLGRRVRALEDKIYPHDVVSTGPGAAARTVFRDKSVLEIKESNQVGWPISPLTSRASRP